MRSIKFIIAAAFFISSNAAAQGALIDNYYENIKNNRLAELNAESVFGDKTNLFDGSTVFYSQDFVQAADKGQDIYFGRKLSINSRMADRWGGHIDNSSEIFGLYWEADVPYMKGTFSPYTGWVRGNGTPQGSVQRCTSAAYQASPPSVVGVAQFYNRTYSAEDYWSGNYINIPGSGEEQVLAIASDMPRPTDGRSYYFSTKSGGVFSCLPVINGGAGEGFLYRSPDGDLYYFDWMASRTTSSIVDTYCANPSFVKDLVLPSGYGNGGGCSNGVAVPRVDVFLYATKVIDRFGNTTFFNYGNQNRHQLTSIVKDNGQSLFISYDEYGKVSEINSNGRVWRYYYSGGQTYRFLTRFVQPDGSEWSYAYDKLEFLPHLSAGLWRTCDPDVGTMRQDVSPDPSEVATVTITHPSGAIGEFSFRKLVHGSNRTPYSCYMQTVYSVGDGTPVGTFPVISGPIKAYVVGSLIDKRIHGPGMSDELWHYQYHPSWSWQSECASVCQSSVTTDVSRPDGKLITYKIGNDYSSNYQKILEEKTISQGVVLRDVVYSYIESSVGQNFINSYGYTLGNNTVPSSFYNRPEVGRIEYVGGDSFSRSVQSCGGSYCYDLFARPTLLRNFSSLGWSFEQANEYYDNYALWVLGKIRKRYVANANQNNDQSSLVNFVLDEILYNAEALPWKTYRYGKLQQTLTYNTDGTLATAADGAGNTATYSSWKRGLPRSITNPDSTTQSATVDDNGWITSVTDENGYVTGYGYDAMGRLASVVYPTGDALAGGATAYHGTWANYRALTSADWKPAGVSDGQWRKLEGTGDHISVTYYDALWRPVLTNDYDQNNVAPTLRSVRTEYDTSGRKSFESYPSSSGVPGSTGIRTFYDALDRVKRVEQDSELGILTTTTDYLSGLRTRVTNPRGKQTTTTFMAWDQPGYDLPILSEQPEGKVIQIARHPQFGWPLSMTQRNAANTLSQTRRYVYDGNAQLCKTIEPETGATVTGYDAAGNPSWSAAGLDANAYASTTDCQHAAAYASGRVSTRTYDTRNRLSVLDFPDHRGKQVWTYTPDGKPASITVYNLANDPQPVITAYNYNHRRLLTGETLTQQNWYSWTMGYAYDAYGNLASQTYPTGLTVAYAPNPLGQATQAGSYATGAQYYPNGALKQFTYGNGIVHTMTQNARQLPSQVTSSGTTNYTYNYDADGNITNIWDLARGDNYSRWMTYDDLDRLTSAGSASFGGDAWHRFTYDALDNLASWKLAGVKDYAEYVYNAQNLLTNIRNTAGASVVGLGYDLQGNVSNKNGQTYDFDYGNRLRTVTGKESYRYDGLGRRVQSTATDGSKTTTWQYTQSGQMAFSSDWMAPGQSNQKTHENVYLAGSVVAIIDHDWPSNAVIATKYQHTDALGSPVAVTNAAGTVIERNDYEPYGAVIGKPAYSGIGYTGHVMDGGTGLTYMQQRYYDDSIGRFLSVDPVSADYRKNNLNSYYYAANNPYSYIDPDGRELGCITLQVPCTSPGTFEEKITSLSSFINPFMPAADCYRDGCGWGGWLIAGISAFPMGKEARFLPKNTYFSGGARYLSKAIEFNAPAIFRNAKGFMTNGRYILDEAGMAKHMTGQSGKSQFLYRLDARKMTLDAAAFADEAGLWVGNKAKVKFNGPIGVLGETGEITDTVNLYRTERGLVHASPGSP